MFKLTVRTSTASKDLTYCRDLRLEKRVGRSSTVLSCTFILVSQSLGFTGKDIVSAELYYGEDLLHAGLCDRAQVLEQNGITQVQLTSRGYTALMDDTEAYPEINSNVDLAGLISRNLTNSHITAQTGTPTVNYIYVNDNSTVWEAIENYATKAAGAIPFITGANRVCIYGAGQAVSHGGVSIISDRTEVDTRGVLTKVYMMDTEGAYSYSQEASDLIALGLSRVRFYPLDRQWLYDPTVGLSAKLRRSRLFMKVRRVTYAGFLGEELYDTWDGDPIGAIVLRSGGKGTFTTLEII